MPFHLQALGYSEISVLVGYLLFAYVRIASLVVRHHDSLFVT
jgi:hypothetical protein